MPVQPTAEQITLLTPAAKATAEKFKTINAEALAKFIAGESDPNDDVKATGKATFESADTNNDGVLEEFEYLDFAQKMLGNWKAAYGDAIEYNEAGAKANFAALNQITAGVDGVSAKDLIISHTLLLAALAGEI